MKFVPNVRVHIKTAAGWQSIALYAPEKPGPAYSREEWETCSSADWEFNEAEELVFHGEPLPGRAYAWGELRSPLPVSCIVSGRCPRRGS